MLFSTSVDSHGPPLARWPDDAGTMMAKITHNTAPAATAADACPLSVDHAGAHMPAAPTDSPARYMKQIHDLQAVLEVSRDITATNELLPLLRKVEQAALRVLDCERATVFLYDRERHELVSRVSTGVDEIRFSADQGIAGEVVRTGHIINVPDAYADPRFNPEIDRKTGFRTRNMVTFPLLGFDKSTVGVLQVLNKHDGHFDPWDHDLVETFGAQIGVAVQRQILLDHFAEKQRMEADLNIARDIQRELIPKEPPNIEGYDIAGWNKPADQTGGDCFDYFTLPDGSLAMTIADATGHGIGPALMIAECRALFRATASMSTRLQEVTGRINNLLCADLPDDRFVTSFFGILFPERNELSYLSAGHGPLVKYTAATDRIEELPANGVPLGIMPDLDWSEPDTFEMSPGDILALVTDGYFEWKNAANEQFGTERILDIVRTHRSRPACEIIRILNEAVLAFAGGTSQADDLTALVVKKL